MFMRALIASVALLASSSVLAAESARLKIPEFSHLKAKAVESVDITVGPFGLWLGALFAPKRTDDGTEVRKIIRDLDAVYIRSYKFRADDVYSSEDVEGVREQLQREDWKPLVEVRSSDSEDVDIFVAVEGDKPTGFAVIASGPRELTIINVVGTIDPQHIGRLQATLGWGGSNGRMAALDE